jgi:hypothetical protein
MPASRAASIRLAADFNPVVVGDGDHFDSLSDARPDDVLLAHRLVRWWKNRCATPRLLSGRWTLPLLVELAAGGRR